jgi:hypothetical protein
MSVRHRFCAVEHLPAQGKGPGIAAIDHGPRSHCGASANPEVDPDRRCRECAGSQLRQADRLMRAERKFSCPINAIPPVQSYREKYSASPHPQVESPYTSEFQKLT